MADARARGPRLGAAAAAAMDIDIDHDLDCDLDNFTVPREPDVDTSLDTGSQTRNEYERDFTAEEELQLVALLNRYSAQLREGDAATPAATPASVTDDAGAKNTITTTALASNGGSFSFGSIGSHELLAHASAVLGPQPGHEAGMQVGYEGIQPRYEKIQQGIQPRHEGIQPDVEETGQLEQLPATFSQQLLQLQRPPLSSLQSTSPGGSLGSAAVTGGSLLGSMGSLGFPSSAELNELLDSTAVFPAELELSVPGPQPLAATSTRGDEAVATAIGVEEASGDGAKSDGVRGFSHEDGIKPEIGGKNTKNTVDASLAPVARWRSYKPLSVTDLVSPAWCELQYSLSLQHFGRKRRTAAMKKGSAVHQRLEDEVHATFQVAVASREDAWALRLWNVIQGARTLRETSMTRELEVWGVVHGQLVSGIVDELGYECPDRELEQQAHNEAAEPEEGRQQTIESFFKSRHLLESEDSASRHRDLVYLTDIKTRTVRSLPRGSSFRPTAMQLMLYHRMLSDLCAGRVNPQLIWDRYRLDPDAAFSDAFVAQFAPVATPSSSQLSSLSLSSPSPSPSSPSLSPPFLSQDAQPRDNWPGPSAVSIPSTAHTQQGEAAAQGEGGGEAKEDAGTFGTQTTDPSSLTVSLEDLHGLLLRHRSLRPLWDAMLAELAAAVPDGLGAVLTAQYRTQDVGGELSGELGGDESGHSSSNIIGSKSFLLDAAALDAHLAATLDWWEGRRAPRGVAIEEAWKCGGCEFADSCAWRRGKLDEAVRRFRARNGRGSPTSKAAPAGQA